MYERGQRLFVKLSIRNRIHFTLNFKIINFGSKDSNYCINYEGFVSDQKFVHTK